MKVQNKTIHKDKLSEFNFYSKIKNKYLSKQKALQLPKEKNQDQRVQAKGPKAG